MTKTLAIELADCRRPEAGGRIDYKYAMRAAKE
jgi:hypothetical protein